jgi:sugar (pentulose or hexulose) kinase
LWLTGEALSEPSDASATLLYDLEAGNWPGPVIETLGLRRNLFPPLISSEALAGTLTREASVSLGLPVAAGGSDTAAALLGSVYVPAGAEGVTFLPYLSGERTPHLDPDARGAWIGLDLAHRRSHLLRTAFERVAFALRDGLEALEEAGVQASEIRLAGDGVLHESWRNLLAEVIGRPLGLLHSSVAPNERLGPGRHASGRPRLRRLRLCRRDPSHRARGSGDHASARR